MTLTKGAAATRRGVALASAGEVVRTWEDRLRAEIEAEQVQLASASVTSISLAEDFVLRATKDVPWQADFVYDKCPRKALFGERRGGKSTAMALAAIEQALRQPFSKILYVGLTQDSCKRVFYDEILARFKRIYSLPATLIGGDQMRFENGSIIYLIGLDATSKQKEKVRGFKSSLNLIDEMQSYTQDVGLIIREVLGPSTADTKAATILGGTAGNALGENFWYELTCDNTKAEPLGPSAKHPEWTVYRCEWSKNTAVDDMTGQRICDNVREYLDEQIAKHPGIEHTDSWRQEWEACWVISTSSLIYQFSDANRIGSSLCLDLGTGSLITPPSPDFLATASYVMGIDLGYNDPTAMTILCYNTRYSNRCYVVETFNESSMIVSEVAARVKLFDRKYHFDYMVGDSSSLQVFETLQQQYGLTIKKAQKQGKLSHQHVLNSDLQTRSLVIMPGNDELIRQLQTCQWEAKALRTGDYVEDPKFKNDVADSCLYAFTFSRNTWYNAPVPKKKPTGREYTERLTEYLIDRNREASMDADLTFGDYDAFYHGDDPGNQ